MSRDITTQVSNALSDDVIRPFFAVELNLDAAPVYMWSGYGDLVVGAKTYLGVGSLLNISSVTETTEMDAKGATITLSGIPSSFLSLALQQPYQGRECDIYFGLFTLPEWILADGSWRDLGEWVDAAIWNDGETQVYANLTNIFSGELDQMNIEEGADTAVISVTAENVLIKLERPVVRRFTNEDQKSRFPNDRGLEYVAGLQDKDILWGRVAK